MVLEKELNINQRIQKEQNNKTKTKIEWFNYQRPGFKAKRRKGELEAVKDNKETPQGRVGELVLW